MRSPSIFQDLKLLQKSKTPALLFFGQSSLQFSKIKSENHFNDISLQGKKKSPFSIFLVFSSFESKNVNFALKLLQKFTSSLVVQLSSFQSFQKTYKKLAQKPLSIKPVTAKKPKPSSSAAFVASDQSFGLSFEKTNRRFQSEAISVPCTSEPFKLTTSKVVGILQTLRAVIQPAHFRQVPQSSTLYTVVKSPHVFKKTREQFASTLCKSVVKLNFKSSTVASLFLNSFFLLKFPCEVKVVLKNF
uniref:Ribosomal protein S10 n=1 Tax=Gloeotilopsis planctonica TaxID=34157 RepID=A0A1B2RYZ0_9CHLO|nr:ribosomal protein S10 [Gloeotilopsis planctonica]